MLRSLQFQIILGIFLGAFAGLFFGEAAAVLAPLGQAFIMLLKMSVLPLMSASLIHAVGRLSATQAARVLKIAVLSLLTIWGLCITVILSVSWMFPSNNSPSFHSELPGQSDGGVNLLELFIPTNPFHALANDIVPGVVLFSLLFGLALMRMRKKDVLLDNLHLVVQALTEITDWITRLTPIGGFALMAVTTGTMPFHEFSKIKLYFFAYIIGICILVFLIFPLLVSSITTLSPRRFLSAIRPAILLGFTTGNTIITLPHTLKALMQLAEEERLNHEDAENTAESVVPIAYNFPTVGNVFALLFMLFISFFYAVPMSLGEYGQLFSLGLPVLFGSGNSTLNAVSFLLDQFQLPMDGLSLFLETMPLTRNFQMLGSSAGIATVGLLAMFSFCGGLRISAMRLGRSALVVATALVIAVVGIRMTMGSLEEEQPIFMDLSVKHPVEWRLAENLAPRKLVPGQSLMDAIIESGELRVGFTEDAIPFSYINNTGEPAGYDVAMAHDLARTLNCRLVFVPVDYRQLAAQLAAGRYDIAMAAISVTDDRMQSIRFSASYQSNPRVLLVEDFQRERFGSYDQLGDRRDWELAVLAGSSFEQTAAEQFPGVPVVQLQHVDDFLESGNGDAMLWSSAEGTTWSLIHPRYTVVATDHDLGKEHYAYALPPEGERFAELVDTWLDIRKLDQFTQQQYNYWVKGEADDTEPRWSIIRDVLHWVD